MRRTFSEKSCTVLMSFHAKLLISLFILTPSTMAGDLRAPFDFETTAVLPQGVRNPRFKNLITFMDTKFGGSGGAEPLGYKLNKTVSWQDVIDAQNDKDPTLGAVTAGKVASLGFSTDGAAGTTSGVVNTYANIKVPVFAMGVSERLTLAVAVPVVDVEVNADTGFAKTEQGQQFVNSMPTPEKSEEAARNLNDAVNSKLRRYGYDPIQSQRVSNIGDIKTVAKYSAYKSRQDAVSLKGELTVPSGTAPNADKALDVPTGDGQWDVGAMVIYDRFLDRKQTLRANFYAGYTAQLPDHLERRLPVSEEETLSRDKEMLERDLGDIVSVGAGLVYQFPFGINIGASYGFQHLDKVSFEGSRFPDYRYRLLESNTRQVLHSATLGLGFSSVEMYKAAEFVAPFQLNFAYCRPLKGMNVVKNELLSFEVVLFF